jgi:arginyl-tRNA synthetase
MTILENIRLASASAINKIKPGLEIKPEAFVYPPQSEMGDLSLPLFQPAKQAGQNPAALAVELADSLNQDLPPVFSKAAAAGPYLNFFLEPSGFIAFVMEDILRQDETYGRNHDGGGQPLMIEYSNGNTHKECHVGHLRNIVYGAAVGKLLAASGWQVIPVSYINDFGGFTAKTLWFYLSEEKRLGKAEHNRLLESMENKGALLGRYYALACKRLEDEPEAKAQVSEIMKAIESRHGEIYELWQKTRAWSLAQLQKIYEDLGVKFEKTFYENEYLSQGLEIVQKLYGQNILIKSQRAIIADLEKYDLGVLPIIRGDGTSLYPVADLALAVVKLEYEPRLAQSIYVVDVRQGLYFKQLFKVLELMGYNQKFVHLGYDFVTLPDGLMSSRSGNVITYEEVLSAALAEAIAETRARHEDWDQDRINQIAKALALGALKFEMLKVSRDKIIVFDIQEALRFDGYTAAYLQYTHARLYSIFRKEAANYHLINHDFSGLDAKQLALPVEFKLAAKLARYGESVRQAGQEYDPAEISRYLFELCQLINDYYHQAPIISAPDDLKNARLALIKAASEVLENGLHLLGIEALKEM